jgi:hypothetical protein
MYKFTTTYRRPNLDYEMFSETDYGASALEKINHIGNNHNLIKSFKIDLSEDHLTKIMTWEFDSEQDLMELMALHGNEDPSFRLRRAHYIVEHDHELVITADSNILRNYVVESTSDFPEFSSICILNKETAIIEIDFINKINTLKSLGKTF